MKREDLTIGQPVVINVKKVDGTYRKTTMYVRELKKGNCAGLSHRIDSESIYGILYSIILPSN